MIARPLLAAVLLVALAACDQKGEERAGAAGEILEGSVSDAMIPVDQLRTEPPLAPRKAGGAGKGGERKAGAAKPGDDAPDTTPTPETTAPPLSAPTASGSPATAPAT